MTKRIIAAAVALGALVALPGCNTVRGVGRDLESAANTVDKAI